MIFQYRKRYFYVLNTFLYMYIYMKNNVLCHFCVSKSEWQAVAKHITIFSWRHSLWFAFCVLLYLNASTGILKNPWMMLTHMARSRTAYVIMFAGCSILWALRLQTFIAVSSCEAEYYALSTATREVIPIMELAKEMQEYGFHVGTM